MANKNIKGITIQLDGETKGLEKALSDVDKKSRALQSELKQVDRALKFNPDSVELLAQKQEILSEEVSNTTERLNRLKQAQEQVQQQFEKGEIGADTFRAFQREIIKTESKLDSFKNALNALDDGASLDNLKKDFKQVGEEAEDAKEKFKGMGLELKDAVAGAAAGIGLSGVVEKALDTASINTKIDISFDVAPESVEYIKQAIQSVQTYGIDAESALEGVRRQWALNFDATNEWNKSIVEGAAVISSAYSGLDFTEVIQEVNEIASEFKITTDEALGLTNALLKMGFPPEQIDIIAEYGQQLQRAGFEAKEIQALFAAGVQSGTWNIDNLLDGLKEGRVILAELGKEVPKSMQELLAKTDISVKQMQAWGKAVANGGEDGTKAMVEVAKALGNVNDETIKNALGVEIFGTKWEDQGDNIIETLIGAQGITMDLKKNQDDLNASIEKMNSDPAVKLQQAFADLKEASGPLLLMIADIVDKLAEWISNNPQLSAGIIAIVTTLGILVGILTPLISGIITLWGWLSQLGPVFTFIFGWLSKLAPAFGWIRTAIGALSGPIGWIILAITAIVTAIIWAYNKFEWFRNGVNGIFTQIALTIKTWVGTATGMIKAFWKLITGDFSGAKREIEGIIDSMVNFIISSIKNLKLFGVGQDVINGLINGINSKVEAVKATMKDVADSITQKVKNILGIASPSKVMMEMGEWTGEGLALGIKKSLSGITRQAESMSQAAIPKTIDTPAKSHGSNDGDTYNFADMFRGANFNIREEADIQKLAKMFGDYVRMESRKGGVVF